MDTLIQFGGALKTLDETGKVGGYLVRFGGKDLDGEGFTPETYYGARGGDGADCLFHHNLPLKGVAPELSDHLFTPIKATKDEIGIFAETILNLADDYEKTVHALVKAGKLGWSSGAPQHMVKKSADGTITRWPIAEGSFTPTPAEPRNRVISLKTYQAELAAPVQSVKGLFKDKLAEQTPSWWQYQNIFCEVVKDIANAARSSRVTDVQVDVPALVRGAFTEYADALLPTVITQVEAWAQDTTEEYFYLKSARDKLTPGDLAHVELALSSALKVGRRNSNKDQDIINRILALVKELGAAETQDDTPAVADTALKSMAWLDLAGLELATL